MRRTYFLLLAVLSITENVKCEETVPYWLPEGGTRICLARTDDDPCPPDHQIEACEKNYTKVRCVPCAAGLRQCDWSTSAHVTPCYDPSFVCSANGDNVVIVMNQTSGGCRITCQCNEAQGYTGSDSQLCHYNGFPCRQTHYRAIPGGECYPCPVGSHNPWNDGIDKCIEKRSSTSTSPVKPDRRTATTQTTTATPEMDQTTQTVLPVVEKNSSEHATPGVTSSTDTGQWVGISISLALVAAIITALAYCFYLYRKRHGKAADIEGPPEADGPDQVEAREATPLVHSGPDQAEAREATALVHSGPDQAEAREATVFLLSDPREHAESWSLLTSLKTATSEERLFHSCHIKTASGGCEPSTKLKADQHMCAVTSTVPMCPNCAAASSAKKSLESWRCDNYDEPDNQLYRQIKEKFCSIVDPAQLLRYLKCSQNDDERISEIQESKGRGVAAHQLLQKLVKHQRTWVTDLCEALRHYDLQLDHLADFIQEQQRLLCPAAASRGDVSAGPAAMVRQEVGYTEEEARFSSVQRKQQTEVKVMD